MQLSDLAFALFYGLTIFLLVCYVGLGLLYSYNCLKNRKNKLTNGQLGKKYYKPNATKI